MRPFLLALLPFSIACSAPQSTPGTSDGLLPDAAEGASSAALIVFERTVSADETVHASAVARFIKMRSGAVDEQTLRMVGGTLDLPALGTCASTGDGESASSAPVPGPLAGSEGVPVAPADGPRAVELLDVGSFALEASGVQTTFEARSLPDIVDLVTGVLYSTRAAALDALPASGPYVLRGAGSTLSSDAEHNVAAFSVSTTAPGEPSDLRIDDQDARGEAGVALTGSGPIDLSWEVADTSDPDDLVYVEIASSKGSMDESTIESAGKRARCLFADHGAASIPASVFGAFGASNGSTHGTLVVHRLHQETFQVAAEPASGRTGLDSGVVRFDFARSVEFTREPTR